MTFRLSIVLFLCFIKSFSQEKNLNYFLEKAQNNSPLLKDYNNQIQAASIDSLLYRATRKPQITGNVNALYAPVFNNIGYDSAITNGQSVSGLVGVNQKIMSKKLINSQSETFKIIKDALVLNQKIAKKDLNKSIISQYITTFGISDQMEYNKKLVTLLNDETTILKKLTQNSIYKQTDYLIFLATVKQQELVLLQLKQQYQNDLSLLNYLSGEIDTTYSPLIKPEITLKPIESSGKNIFLKQFAVDSLKIKNQDNLIDNNYKPAISLIADAGYLSSLTPNYYNNFGFSIGAGVSIPIYDGNQRSLQHQKNQTALESNIAYKNNFTKQYTQQLLMLRQQLKNAKVIENQLQSQLKISEALIEADKKLFVTGDVQITDYSIALSNLISIKNAITQNYINKLQIINEINYWSFYD